MTEKRPSSVSYKSEQPSDDENAQLSLDPQTQLYLAHLSQQNGCWGRFFPIPFERAAQKSWWDPTFDSEILEEQYRRSSNPHSRFKFRYALWYMLLISSSWLVYFLVTGLVSETHHWPMLCTVLGTLILSVTTVLFLTYTDIYNNHMLLMSLIVAFVLCVISLSFVVLVPMKTDPLSFPITSDISPVGHFSICIEILMLIYTLIPLKLYMSITIGFLYSAAFETLTISLQNQSLEASTITVRLLSHFCIHVIGLHILIMTNVRMRNTFMKVGQSLLVRRQLESEKKLKENMIHSLMPSSVAEWLLSEEETFTRSDQRNSDPETNDIRSLFRPFNMNRMENVSILFADIVGFTKMASKKSAEELVEILNNLFQRFDHLCKFHNCEKISTLGDCYYCVSGCPEPRHDHAKCCVEMGLSMIQAIKQFDQEKNEGVNMRVGVHTGTVLCGIVGTRRFKFDVWSNDVTLANRMESTGKPGMVHVSEKTCEFLQDMYLLEEGEPVLGMKTYFILGRTGDKTPSYSGSFRAEGRQKYTNSLQLFVSPPTSSPSMSPQSRPRVLSCDTTHIKATHNPNMLSPDVCKIKASSLPSILDSENEQDGGDICKETSDCDNIKTPTSTASSGKYSVKLKNWKMPKFLRKNDGKPELDIEVPANSEDRISGGYQQVPTIIETSNVSNGKKKDSFISVTDVDDDNKRSSIFLDDPKDTIDVKSYISQSRSDIGQYDYSPGDLNQFMRTGSYRSQYGRSPNEFSFLQRAGSNRSRRGRSPNFDVFPGERQRSTTVCVGNLERPKMSLEVPGRLTNISVLDDHFSVYSRKDSGIRSNSRRSSIQQLEQATHPNSEHRVSGYYTSSQSTVTSPQYNVRMPGVFKDKFGTCIQNLRKQSDRQLIKCVQENSKSRGSYFIKPPLRRLTLFFKDKQMEQDYRTNVHSLFEKADSILTLADSKFNTYFDVCVSSLVFAIVSISLWLLYGHTTLWLVMSGVFVAIQACGWALCSRKVVECSDRCLRCVSRFYRWNMFGAVLVSLPLVTVLINFCTKVFTTSETSNYLYTYLLFVGVIHFCNFTQLNCWMKNCLAVAFTLIFIPLFLNGTCSNFFVEKSERTELNPIVAILDDRNRTEVKSLSLEHYSFLYKSEILMDLFLLLVLVWLLNREFEIGYRLSFHANYVSNRDKINVQNLKTQADYLIYNIVPEHVAEQLKKNAKYSENFKDVGIIFASIVNFNEMYDESYLGGKEYLRVLNELIADFDELLDRPEFASVEKIKTIGSTFMAASGLNSTTRRNQKDPNEHLYALMDFALEMQNVITDFNRDLLEFNLILRIGYNFGEVTAAVIGNTKLYYDIWGDAVNIASRMDSTGVNGCIQIGENCLQVLETRYVFRPRGSVYVKGKDNMSVYLLERKKTDDEIEA
ncbi:adenylate cyclase type 9 isoform X1 [Tribolium castaneum]|uniref:Adenylate cyclase type 9 n=2 Tax=Tribolium castaneum TaxID=7070 RepID=D2A2A1_TRICA|nr:PREDICTED: adenylate cyclase type 9 isoform X1 [Tribolium castaneum]XP_015834366.1 PREDICTED: adenylate cyclase type 9 isoform X1 [Tribolium castaneum]EFA02161.2 hypothetical protein TcasGA2_TC007814 [Tribolium castaneum]|eukprot:XP_008191695.1 PREDICTED: adenylate cyclase type 9 isoform X1 [Tribolium castaneum]